MPYYNVLRMQGAKASASSTLGSFNSLYAIDGSGSNYITNSRWVSNVGTVGEWLQIDLPRLAMINKFILYTGNSADGVNISGNAIRNVDFQIKQNDAWVTVSQTRNNSLTNPKITAQLDKFYLTDSVRLYFPIAEDNFRVFELEAYGRAIGKKALGTTSKNLLKPFTSSDWNYTRPIVSMSPNKVVLDLDQSRTNELVFPAKPNTTYTISGKTDGRVYIVQRTGATMNTDKVGTGYSNWNTINRTITTGSDVTGLRVSLTADGAGIFTYENIMVNEGATALPYQVYEQDMRQARLIPKKNLLATNKRTIQFFNTTSISGGQGPSVIESNVPIKPNTTYVIKFKTDAVLPFKAIVSTVFSQDNGSHNNYYSSAVGGGRGREISLVNNTLVFTTSSAERYFGLTTGNSQAGTYPSTFTIDEIQLEEGSVATPFQKYHGTNKTSVKYGKNLIDFTKMTAGYYVNDANGTLSTSGAGASATDFTPVKGGKTYVFENMPATFNLIMRFAWFDANKNFIGGSNYYSAVNVSKEVTAPPNASYIRSTVLPSEYSKALFYQKDKMGAKQAVLTQPKGNFYKNDDDYLTNVSSAYLTKDTITGWITTVLGSARHTDSPLLEVQQNRNYTVSVERESNSPIRMEVSDQNGTVIFDTGSLNADSYTFNSGSYTKLRVKIRAYVVGGVRFRKIKFEEGTTKTPYTGKYILGAKFAKY